MRVVRSASAFLIGLIVLVMTGCLDRDQGVDTAAQLAADVATIDTYLASNNLTPYKDRSGVRMVITEMGTKGFPARTDQVIKVNYVGKLLDGTVFDQGTTPAVGTLSGFIVGWQYAFTVLPQGTKAKLFIPSTLAYGDKARGTIPANSNLVFDVEFVEVTYTNTEKAQLASDIAAIDSYLSSKSITAVQDSTGVRYVISAPGDGTKPTRFTKVKFTATGKALVSGLQFYSGTSEPTQYFDSRVADYIHGIQLALTKIGKGGKITAYIPSGLAFGPFTSQSSSLPANSNVIYDIELIDIIP